MSKPILIVCALGCLCSAALAQRGGNPESYYQAPSTMMGKTVIIPAGTTFEGRIDSRIGSSVSHSGESFTITMSNPVLANGTDVLIPAGSQITGEVVEAIPSSRQPHHKDQPKPRGKLRVQINTLRTPNGMTYPLVASLVGEVTGTGRHQGTVAGLGSGIAYVGSDASFSAVAPGVVRRSRNGQPPSVITRDQLMRDPIYGQGSLLRGQNDSHIRSLVERGHDLYIDEGSPLSIRLNAPFKISFTGSAIAVPNTAPLDENGRRFSPGSPADEVPATPATPGAQGKPASPQPIESPDSSF